MALYYSGTLLGNAPELYMTVFSIDDEEWETAKKSYLATNAWQQDTKSIEGTWEYWPKKKTLKKVIKDDDEENM